MTAATASDDLSVLQKPGAKAKGSAGSMVGDYLKARALVQLDKREAEYEKLTTPDQIRAWQAGRREMFFNALGEFPARTALNAKVVGRREFADFRIEKIIFESRPGFFVTGTLYLPLAAGPHPVIVHPTGHSEAAKARDVYQRASVYFARNGLACLCYDPVGQGERRQILGESDKVLFGTTQEHQIMGLSCTLLGTSLARTMIWDGMRVIDYLQSRPDIDGSKIGCVGISGGGTMTSYLGAADDRIAASAPGCYLTEFRRLLETLGPQDIEQNLFNQLGLGLDQGDYVLMRAPRPTLIMAATRDFFDIGGTWKIFRESKRAYGRLGFAERVDLVEAPTEHTYPVEHCVAGTRWFGRWFLGRELAVPEKEVTILPEADLYSTPAGQVLRLPGRRTLFDLNADDDAALAPKRRQIWQDRSAGLREVRRVTGIRPAAELPATKVEARGSVNRSGYSVRKLVLVPEEGIFLPALQFEPSVGTTGAPVLYVHGRGKLAAAQPGGAIEKLVNSGRRVLAIDLRGLGETARPPAAPSPYTNIVGHDSKDWALAYLVGDSFVRMRTEDLLTAVNYLRSQAGVNGPAVQLIALADAAVPALHAAALEPQLFSSVEIDGPLVSWAATVRDPSNGGLQINAVFGALRVYDLPDLVASLPKEKLTLSAAMK